MAASKGKQTGGGHTSALENLRSSRVSSNVPGGAGCLVDVPGLAAVLDAVVDSGLAVSLGRTRDMGAIVVTLMENGQREKLYGSDQDELDAVFGEVLEAVSKGYPTPQS